jgi:16S rRNA (guanine527-N7)-methyltransferase
MQQVAIELGLPWVRVEHARVETFQRQGGFPQIISRAFSELGEFVSRTRHLLAPGGEWLAMKGLYPSEEIARLPGARVKGEARLTVPGLEADRHLIVMAAE